jgi:16S rRNA G966 N2-methylase RsmD
MEQRALFGETATPDGGLLSCRPFPPGRSPFIRERLDVRYEADTLEQLAARIEGLPTEGRTFKISCIKNRAAPDYAQQRLIERRLGAVIRGKADMRQPELLFGVVQAQAGGSWLFGVLQQHESVWLRHQAKPRSYSTALSTRTARAVVNIALPYSGQELAGKRLYDPCCGMGTVLIEALSMGIPAAGSDLNPLAVMGARANLAHFGYQETIRVQDIAEVEGSYDAVVVDLPYNLCSVSPLEEQQRILEQARRLSRRAVLVTTEEIEELVLAAGFTVQDSCQIPKGKLVRKVLLCR